MNLFEFYNQYPEEFNNKTDDSTKIEFEDSRKTRLTLKQIQQLRKMNDARSVEKQNEIKKLKKIYGAPAEPAM